MAALGAIRKQHDVWTVHGMRSSFRDWGAEQGHDAMLLELALGHAVGSAVVAAYARSDLLDRRRTVMEAWVAFLTASRVVQNFTSKGKASELNEGVDK